MGWLLLGLHAEKQNRQEIASVLTHINSVLTTDGHKHLRSWVHAEAQEIDLISM